MASAFSVGCPTRILKCPLEQERSVSREMETISQLRKAVEAVATMPIGSVLGVTLQGAEGIPETFTVDIDGLSPDLLPGGITIAAGEGDRRRRYADADRYDRR